MADKKKKKKDAGIMDFMANSVSELAAKGLLGEGRKQREEEKKRKKSLERTKASVGQ